MSIEELVREGSIHPFKATQEEVDRAIGIARRDLALADGFLRKVWAGKRIAIKCAHRNTPQIGLSLAMLGRVQNIITALEDKDGGYTLYQLDPRWYRAAMVPSRSNSPSAQTVMMVSCKEIRTVGQATGRMPSG